MTKVKTAILNKNQETVGKVFSDEQLQQLSECSDLMPGVQSEADVESGKLSQVEVLFSTWGMPSLTEQQLDQMPHLKAVLYAAGATDYFALPLLRRGIRVSSAWLANAIPVAEFCTAQIILSLKGYFRTVGINRRNRSFDNSMAGPGVYGETVALIGSGAISCRIQELLKNYNVKVMVVATLPEERSVTMKEAFSRAMVVSNHLPDWMDNEGVINGELLASMRQGATFINSGRGRQVREQELLAVLKKRPDLMALLDVTYPEPPDPNSDFYTLPNVWLSPHMAGSMNDELHRMSSYMIQEFQRYIAGEPLQFQVMENMLQKGRSAGVHSAG